MAPAPTPVSTPNPNHLWFGLGVVAAAGARLLATPSDGAALQTVWCWLGAVITLALLARWKGSEAPRQTPILPARLALRRVPRSHYPFVDARGVMGLRPLEQDSGGVLLDVDSHYLAHVELKRTLFRCARERVFAEADGAGLRGHARLASHEALEFVVQRLAHECPGLLQVVEQREGSGEGSAGHAKTLVNASTGHFWRVDTHGQSAEHPLVIAAQNVQEDLVVLLPSPEEGGGEYVVAAAAVCFADQWDVAAKIGKPLTHVHAPVEAYPRVAAAVNAFFRNLQPGDEKIRYNFTFCERSALHQPHDCGDASDCPLPDTGLPSQLHLRVERQGLIRLPQTHAVLFTIRTYLERVQDLPEPLRAPLAAELRDTSGQRTTVSRANKLKYGERVCAALGL